jgi:hypothetical protein
MVESGWVVFGWICIGFVFGGFFVGMIFTIDNRIPDRGIKDLGSIKQSKHLSALLRCMYRRDIYICLLDYMDQYDIDLFIEDMKELRENLDLPADSK